MEKTFSIFVVLVSSEVRNTERHREKTQKETLGASENGSVAQSDWQRLAFIRKKGPPDSPNAD